MYMARQSWYDSDECTVYFPKDHLIIQYVRDEHDVIYMVYEVYYAPDMKMALFLSGYAVCFFERTDGTFDRCIDKLDKSIEERIRSILELTDECIVTDDKELFKTKRDEYLAANADKVDILCEQMPWLKYDLDAVKLLHGKHFIDDYPEDEDPEREQKVLDIPWNCPGDYICSMIGYVFRHIDKPRDGKWDKPKLKRDTYVVLMINEF